MSESHWYEEIWFSIGVRPFCWRFHFDKDTHFPTITINIGPFWIAFGWPEFSKQEV